MVPTFRDSANLASEFDADVANEFAVDDREAPDDREALDDREARDDGEVPAARVALVLDVRLGNTGFCLGEVLMGLVLLVVDARADAGGGAGGGALWGGASLCGLNLYQS